MLNLSSFFLVVVTVGSFKEGKRNTKKFGVEVDGQSQCGKVGSIMGFDKQPPYMTYHLLYYIDDLPTKLKTKLSLET